MPIAAPDTAGREAAFLPALAREASFSLADSDSRTAAMTFTTGAPVKRFDWRQERSYWEVLSLDPAHVRMNRLNDGAPLLAAHRSWDLKDVLGVVESAALEHGRGVATVRFDTGDDANEAWRMVRDGVLRKVSVGYIIHEMTESRSDAGEIIRTATDWEPIEISIVPIPADPEAGFRGAPAGAGHPPTHPCRIIQTRKDISMEDEDLTPGADETRDNDALDDHDVRAMDDDEDEGRAQSDDAPDDEDDDDDDNSDERAAPAGDVVSVRTIRTRCQEIGLPESVALDLAERSMTRDQLNEALLNRLSRSNGARTVSRSRITRDSGDTVRLGVLGALLHRADPAANALDGPSRDYAGLSLMELGRAMVAVRGGRVPRGDRMAAAGYLLGFREAGQHSTSDFAQLLADVANKTLRRGYEEAPRTFQPIARRATANDFKPVRRLQLGEFPMLSKVAEGGEYKYGSMAEAGEVYSLATYGKIIGFTRQMLVNDDLDAFSRLPMAAGNAVAHMESDIVWDAILSNPVMADGNALFHASSHKNLASSGAAISVASIGKGREAMRKQTGLDGKTKLNIAPEYLVVPAALETAADQFVSTNMLANQTGDINVFAGRLKTISEPRLDDVSATAWYLMASPGRIDTVEYCYLAGEEGYRTETRIGFEVDGMEFKISQDFAAKAIDHRGLYKNPGA